MKCLNCGKSLKVTRERYKYDESGLPGISLENVEVRRCHGCGEREVSIPDMEGLHRAMAKFIIEKKPSLTGSEIRFLREFLDLSAVDLAKQMGIDPATLSRWENDGQNPASTADRLLRMMVASTAGFDEPNNWLATVGQEEARALPLDISLTNRKWTIEPCHVG